MTQIDLDANATTAVLPLACAAALQAMAETYGNPSSTHGAGLQARALIDGVRARARQVLGAGAAHVLFVSGATEGIQTAVLSALSAMRERADPGQRTVLVGATEHKAVPEAVRHWNAVLGLQAEALTIPVDGDGRHDLDWLRRHAAHAGLVCTMAVNNETGVISDLHGIRQALQGSAALWLVDSVQALGKLRLPLAELAIDYATFSGHKLHAPKGIGLLVVRPGAPLTPLIVGGGQEGMLRSGTENMPGIAALGAVLQAIEDGTLLQPAALLQTFTERLRKALTDAFPGIVFNAPQALSVPTTLNFSVAGVKSRVLLDLFDAAALRMSGGSACSAATAKPSFVLEAMGLPAWRTASAVRMSFSPATSAEAIDEACRRIQACGRVLQQACQGPVSPETPGAPPAIARHAAGQACSYLLADPASRRCILVDPRPDLVATLVREVSCRQLRIVAMLATHAQGDVAEAMQAIAASLPAASLPGAASDSLGWPTGSDTLTLGSLQVRRLLLARPGAAGTAGGPSTPTQALHLHDAQGLQAVVLGGLDEADAVRMALGPSHEGLLLLPTHSADERWVSRMPARAETETAPAATDALHLTPASLAALLAQRPQAVLVDVREVYEQQLGQLPGLVQQLPCQTVPLSALVNALPRWLALPQAVPLLFFCRTGNRSAQAAAALRALGRSQAYSLAGGLALWPPLPDGAAAGPASNASAITPLLPTLETPCADS